MSFLEAVIARTRTIESLLEDKYHGAGKGLHEKLSSVEDRLDPSIARQIRYIATVRNKLVHESNYDFDGNAADFLRRCDEVIRYLEGGQPVPQPVYTAPHPAPSFTSPGTGRLSRLVGFRPACFIGILIIVCIDAFVLSNTKEDRPSIKESRPSVPAEQAVRQATKPGGKENRRSTKENRSGVVAEQAAGQANNEDAAPPMIPLPDAKRGDERADNPGGRAGTNQNEEARRPSTSSMPTPFSLTLGQSTEAQARDIWQKEGASVLPPLYGNAKPSAYRDDDPESVPNKHIVLIDVEGLPLDNLDSARFGFFDGTLYLIKYEFEERMDSSNFINQLIAKYGKPTASGSFREKTWSFPGVTMVFKDEFIGKDSLIFTHDSILEKATASNQAIYEQYVKTKAQKQRGY